MCSLQKSASIYLKTKESAGVLELDLIQINCISNTSLVKSFWLEFVSGFVPLIFIPSKNRKDDNRLLTIVT